MMEPLTRDRKTSRISRKTWQAANTNLPMSSIPPGFRCPATFRPGSSAPADPS